MRHSLIALCALILLSTTEATGQADRLSGEASQLRHQNSEGVRARAEAGDAFGDALAWGDFNNDGVLDLAVGVPGEDIGDVRDAGAVNVFYGGRDLLLANSGVQIFDQGNNALKGAAEAGDRFGASLAAGDLNGDGIDDLAIGIPGEDVGQVKDAGAVAVLFGTGTGLLATGNLLLYEGLQSFAPGRPAGKNHRFGAALAIGDFYGNGKPRLVVGVPGAEVDGNVEAGVIGFVFPTTGGGWSLARVLYQGRDKVKGRPEPGDQFGSALVVGDFDGNGKDDLAVAAPGESVGDLEQAGVVTVFFGSTDGILETSGNVVFSQNAYGIEDDSEYGDLFGWSLAAGDFNGDRYDDLAVGVPGEDVGDLRDAGAVNVLYGHQYASRVGEKNQLWHQNTITAPPSSRMTAPAQKMSERMAKRPPARVEPPIRTAPNLAPKQEIAMAPVDPAESHDAFGTALAAGDFDADGTDDLAVGVPREDAADVNTIAGSGMSIGVIQILYGSMGEGLSTNRNQLFSQDTQGVEGAAESGDRFGMALAGASLRLAVGVPGEAIGSESGAGAVNVLFSGALKQ